MDAGVTQNKHKLNVDDLAKLKNLQVKLDTQSSSKELNFKQLLVWMQTDSILARYNEDLASGVCYSDLEEAANQMSFPLLKDACR